MMSLEVFFDRYSLPLKKELRIIVQSFESHPTGFSDMLNCHLNEGGVTFTSHQSWNGRCVQPVLCLLACEACGGDWEQALPAAAAIELMHGFVLIHDVTRGGNESQRSSSTWTPWGQAQEINTGDALFALANLALGRLFERGTPAATVLAIFRLFNHAGLAFATGQYLDISLKDCADVSIEDYLAVAEGKAALPACACEMGALIASAADVRRKSLRSFGYHLGLTQYMCDAVLHDWNEVIRVSRTFRKSSKRERIERLTREHQFQAIAALEEENLKAPSVQALCELAQMPFNDVQLFSLVRSAEATPCL